MKQLGIIGSSLRPTPDHELYAALSDDSLRFCTLFIFFHRFFIEEVLIVVNQAWLYLHLAMCFIGC